MDRLRQVADGQGEILASYSYNRAGGLQKLRYGNGIQTEYGYGDDGNLSSLVTVTGQGRVILNFDYAYDGNGNCIRKSGGQYQNEYAYDRMNRLLESVQDGKAEKYTYDLAGNRLRRESGQKTEVYQYNAKNQLTSICSGESIIQYLYDKQGNMLEEQGDAWTKRYTYDAANRQTGIELTGPSETTPGCFRQISRYDGEGLRYETEENGKTIRFLYDRGELAEEKQEDAYISYARGYDPLVLTQNGTDQSYFVPDEMGSTLFLLDRNHEIRKTYHYDAFGAIKDESGEISNRLTFTGQMYERETGQYYLRARFYNPLIGRFTQEDIYRGDGLNLYAYCANNPVMYYDPSGYMGICPIKKYLPRTSPDELRRIDDDIIDQMDSKGGHIQERHVGKSNEYLLQRAIHDGDATSFQNKRTATTAIKENIRRNVNRISDWLNNPKAKEYITIYTTHKYPIGYGVETTAGVINKDGKLISKASKNVTYGLTSSKVYIVKDSDMPNRYKIVTAYPVFD